MVCLRPSDQEPWRWTKADRSVAEEMCSYWANFAKTGNPNGRGLSQWPAFANADGKVLYIGDPITFGGVANINSSLKVFDSVYTMVRGKPFAAR
jgi:carboxylesterase type B